MPRDDVTELAQNSLTPLANCPRCRIAGRSVCTCNKRGNDQVELDELSESEDLLKKACVTSETPAISLAALTPSGQIKAGAAGDTKADDPLDVNNETVR